MIKRLLYLIFFILLVGCSSMKIENRQLQEQLLDKHLNSWQKFRFDGLIEINHKNLALHKYFTLRKTNSIARLDIYDTGLLGLKPAPFISVYYDSLIQARIPDIPEIKVLKPADYPEYFRYFEMLNYLDQLRQNKDEIITNNNIEIDNLKFHFDFKERISRISSNAEDIVIDLKYKKVLQEISISKNSNLIAVLQIDEIKYEFNKISPLIK